MDFRLKEKKLDRCMSNFASNYVVGMTFNILSMTKLKYRRREKERKRRTERERERGRGREG